MKNILKKFGVGLIFAAIIAAFAGCSSVDIKYNSSTLAIATVGTEYSQDIATATVEGDYTIVYSLKSNNTLPEGLSLSEAGILSGTPAEAVTDHKFVVVANASGCNSAEAEFSITVQEKDELVYNASVLSDARVDVEYFASVASATGADSIRYELKSGNELPAGLSLSNDGSITGTPTQVAENHKFIVVATAGNASAEAEFAITVAEADASITFIMESEYVNFFGISGPGISGSAIETQMIGTDNGGMYQASNGHYVAYCHGAGITFTYNFTSDKATTAKLYLRLASDCGDVSGYGSNALSVKINGEEVHFGNDFTITGICQDFLITDELTIIEGENVITLTTLENDLFPEENGGHGTASAFGPLFDCVKIVSDANLEWTAPLPFTDNY